MCVLEIAPDQYEGITLMRLCLQDEHGRLAKEKAVAKLADVTLHT